MNDTRLERKIWGPYVEDIALACVSRFPNEDAATVTAVGLRETIMGTCRDYVVPPGQPVWMGRGDYGHGWGFFQIDDRGPFKYLLPAPGDDWSVYVQACCACVVLADARRGLEMFRSNVKHWEFEQAVCASYNLGVPHVTYALRQGIDPDRLTTPGPRALVDPATGRRLGDYGKDVLMLRDGLRRAFPTLFPTPAGQLLATTPIA